MQISSQSNLQYGVGVDIGGSFVKLGVVEYSADSNADAPPKIINKFKISTAGMGSSSTTFADNLARSIYGLIRETKVDVSLQPENNDSTIAAIRAAAETPQAKIIPTISRIGVGVPGCVEDGKIIDCANIPYLANCHLAQLLSQKLKFNLQNITLDNDANMAAKAEVAFGDDRIKSAKNIVMITIGTGIGGAVFANGVLQNGARGLFGEVGRMRIFGDKTFEEVCSATALKTMAVCDDLTEIFPPLNNATKAIIASYAQNLGMGISNIINCYDPSCIILGGGISFGLKYLLPEVLQEVQKHNYGGKPLDEYLTILSATFGNNAGIIGCIV
ncbi:MAG: ROK family protein [Clostridiales bacterium]|jgi:glucokinase|nr:ROK family protein [Clostridiales bacterium]